MWQDLWDELWEDGENADFLVALGIGAVVGLGLAMLFRPQPATRRERLVKELKPYRKELDKRARKARDAVGRRATAARRRGDEVVDAGREALDSLRGEIAEIVADAREEITAAVESQVGAAQKALKKNAKRFKS